MSTTSLPQTRSVARAYGNELHDNPSITIRPGSRSASGLLLRKTGRAFVVKSGLLSAISYTQMVRESSDRWL